MAMNVFSEWQDFYVIVGSAGAALTGLQFVTMALIAEMPLRKEDSDASAAFSTPSIVHFSVVLLAAAAMVMPWHGVTPAAVILEVAGLLGVGYIGLVGWRLRTQKAYAPVLEDWALRIAVPLMAYGGLAVSAYVTRSAERAGLFGVAAVMLLLLVIGIHNTWDNVTYLVFEKRRKDKARQHGT
jgi:hypothetical protein